MTQPKIAGSSPVGGAIFSYQFFFLGLVFKSSFFVPFKANSPLANLNQNFQVRS